jgi:ABC-type branched-subunit amino acid transport system ATPase component
MVDNNVILKVEHMSKSFGGVQAVFDVSFEVLRGELLGIIGPNGSGKSTLVNLITGFVKADGGRVFYHSKEITGKKPYAIANLGIARTFQMAKAFPDLSAFKSLIIPLYSPRVRKFRGGKFGERDDAAVDLLEEVGFERDSSVPFKTAIGLPHGYLKRLELARCMALRPEVMILDELFSGMSMAEVASALPIVEKLREEGTTLLMIEHRLKELFRVANRVMVLNYGQKIADGPPHEVMNFDAVKKAYLGSEE